MSLIQDFAAGLTRARKTVKEVQETTEAAYSKMSKKRTQIYEIMKTVKEGKTTMDKRQNNGRRKVKSPVFITKIAAEIEGDR
jgi:hypothetical protein